MFSDFDLNKLYSAAANRDTFFNGVKLYMDKKIRVANYEVKDGSYVFFGETATGQKPSVTFSHNGELEKYGCSCTFGLWRGACAHVISLIYAIVKEDEVRLKESDYTNLLSNLVDEFKHILLGEVFAEYTEPTLAFEPELSFQDNFLFASFYFRSGKQRVRARHLHSLPGFFREQTTIEYTKKLKITHRLEAFDENSQRLIRLVNRTARSMSSSSYNPLSQIQLYGGFLDDFFDLFEDQEIECTNGPYDNIRLSSSEITPSFSLEEKDGLVQVTSANGSGRIISGFEHDYVLNNGLLTRVSAEYIKAMQAMNTALKKVGGSLSFDSTAFGNYIFPTLVEAGLAEAKLELPKLTPRLYFDSSKEGISCRADFCYGDKIYSPRQESDTVRDLKNELKILVALESFGFLSEPEGSFNLSDNDNIYLFYTEGLDKIKTMAEVFVTDSFGSKFIPRSVQHRLGVRVNGDLLELDADLSAYSLHDLLELAEALKVKKKFHRLRDGRIVELDNNQLAEAIELVESLGVSSAEYNSGLITLQKSRALYLDSLFNDKDDIQFDTQYKTLVDDITNFHDANCVLPSSLEKILRDYQKEGFKWLKCLAHYGFGGVLADDMGLGKTLQMIALLLSERGGVSLVVAPTSLIFNWEREFMRFAPELKVTVVSGTPAARKELLELESEVYITTYDMLKRDHDLYAERSFRFLVADEAQYIKNPTTKNAQAIKTLKASSRFALTGTPMENSLTELWSIFDFAMPGYLFSYSKFSKLYETPIVKNGNTAKTAQLRKQINPFILRRTKKDVLSELPEKVETVLYAELLPEQKKIYSASILQARMELSGFIKEDSLSRNSFKVLSHITRLRQICCHPSLFMDNYKGGSGKMELALETIKMAIGAGHRPLIFSQFTSMLSLLMKATDHEGIQYFYLDGGTDSRLRTEMMESFNSGQRQAFFISLKAGGTGLNLTGADVVIHYDPWWNPAVMNQATDRAHRFGQDKSVQVIYLVAKDSIEEKIIELHTRKQELFSAVIVDGGDLINRMTKEEIVSLFEG